MAGWHNTNGATSINDGDAQTANVGGFTWAWGAAAPGPLVKAELDLATTGDGNIDTVVRAKLSGKQGNDITIELIGDSLEDAGVTLVETSDAVTIHYEVDVSTIADLETAIGTSDIIEVKTTGTGATVLIEDDAFPPTSLEDGAGIGVLSEPAVFMQDGGVLWTWNGTTRTWIEQAPV